jgi:hypothetical protein
VKIFTVHGTTGEYSDRSEWVVCAYTKEEDAKQHIELASEYARLWKEKSKSADYLKIAYSVEGQEMQEKANPMDPKFSMDYTGTSYWLEEVELNSSFVSVEVVQ